MLVNYKRLFYHHICLSFLLKKKNIIYPLCRITIDPVGLAKVTTLSYEPQMILIFPLSCMERPQIASLRPPLFVSTAMLKYFHDSKTEEAWTFLVDFNFFFRSILIKTQYVKVKTNFKLVNSLQRNYSAK